jgi:hypothetical protein
MTPEHIRRLRALGISLIPLQPRSKIPDGNVLGDDGKPTWKPYQTTPPIDSDYERWFGNGVNRNAGILLGPISGFVVIETDSRAGEDWAQARLPPTPMRTRSARGIHRFYRLPDPAWP